MNKELRVWHIHNLGEPNEACVIPVASVEQAIVVLDALATYDLFLGESVISSNAQGLEVRTTDDVWEGYEDDEGRCINEIRSEKEEERDVGCIADEAVLRDAQQG